jgi:hypothetical protein
MVLSCIQTHNTESDFILVVATGLAEHAQGITGSQLFLKPNVQLYCIDHLGQECMQITLEYGLLMAFSSV